jgi:hypothetical protein
MFFDKKMEQDPAGLGFWRWLPSADPAPLMRCRVSIKRLGR